ncbi:hypothetical protein UNDKW_3781 [Undibacterium sp. KW1]|uniref:NADAR family protein n=1 Tax=Undibacterium sp. KW1 TaxID=2058624 RepID=UPI001331D7A0|nr:NADAR family protein [Undibacterium sp. KW1]BBB62054.1 hypothetical protein UNDKW_3781 [Undibacterium sp. KW1]
MNKIKKLADLIERINQGDSIEYLFFMGHRQKKGSAVSEECLSQWYASSFEVEGILYKTAEHYMMAAKARLFGDADALQEILESATPAEAKSIGRRVKAYDDELWVQHRYALVVAGNYAKFAQNAKLKEYILSTNALVLVEASAKDRIWGIGLGINDPGLSNPRHWKGLNLLGFALMEVRDLMRAEAENSNKRLTRQSIYIGYVNPVTEDIDPVLDFAIACSYDVDWGTITISEAKKFGWHEVNLPNGELIEIMVLINPINNDLTVNARQKSQSLLQLICKEISSLFLRTLGEALIEIEIRE